MEFKGTKGEWNISKDINDNERVCIVSDSNDNFIDCWSLQFCSEEEMRANAQLIATAPELLKALRYILDQKENEHCSTYMDEVCEYAEKVINKALGND